MVHYKDYQPLQQVAQGNHAVSVFGGFQDPPTSIKQLGTAQFDDTALSRSLDHDFEKPPEPLSNVKL